MALAAAGRYDARTPSYEPMRTFRYLSLLSLLVAVACSSDPNESNDAGVDAGSDTVDLGLDPTDPDADTQLDTAPDVDVDDAEVGLPTCNPALALEPAEATLAPLDLLQMRPSGGTGDYRVRLTDNQTGAIFSIGELRYIAGDTPGVDTLTLTDDGCAGEATSMLTVVEHPNVVPSNIEVSPGTTFTFEVTGGSGEYVAEFITNRTGGTLSDEGFVYTSGARPSFDVLRFTDVQSGRAADATVSVSLDARLRLETSRVALPVGGTYQLEVLLGSGRLELADESPPWFDFEDGVISGLAPGEWTQLFVDPFSGLTAAVEIDIVEPLDGEFTLAGDRLTWSTVQPLGDINGDGFADVAVAIAEADVDAYNSGAVFIYLGAEGEIDAAPAQVLSGTTYQEEFGRGIGFGDIDADGSPELMVGASNADIGGSDIGAVYIFDLSEDDDQLFDDTPSATLAGLNGGDRYGMSIATCDFDQDGILDMAVGAYLGENRDEAVVRNNQGAVFIYRGQEGAYPVAPTRTVHGEAPVDGRWRDVQGLQMGLKLAAGDFDGDGACDIAAGSFNATVDGGGADGLVIIYRGIRRTTSQELVSPRASIAVAATGPFAHASNFSRSLAAGDVDNDGRDELIVGATGFDVEAGNDAGGVFIYEWDEPTLPFIEEYVPVETAVWTYSGSGGSHNAGATTSIGDANGDGIDDIIVGAWRGDVDGEDDINAPGSVHVFLGRDGELPSTEPELSVGGIASNIFFGEGAAAFGDADGDGDINFMVVAGRFDEDGIDYPQAFHFDGLDEPEVRRAVLPVIDSGYDFGRGVGLVGDVTGDGNPDIVTGAPLAASLSIGTSAGEVLVYPGAPDEIALTPSQRLGGHPGHSSGDLFGWRVAGGDFNGDGTQDLFVVSRNDDMPGSFGEGYHDPFECTGGRNNSSMVAIYLGEEGESLSFLPSFVFYPNANTQLDDIAVGDFDGDGRDDLLLGSGNIDRPGNGNCGGVILLRGRRHVGGGDISVLCEPDLLLFGGAANDRLGVSVAHAGDVDLDGCDDFVAGAPGEDLRVANQGTVRLLYGAGVRCGDNDPRVVILGSGRSSSNAGFSVDAGEDVDGDGVPDVIVGGPTYREGFEVPGAAWLLSGARIRDLPTLEAEDGEVLPRDESFPFVNVGAEGTFGLTGRTTDEQFGTSVALVPDIDGDGRGEVAVGAPRADYAGSGRTGAVAVFPFVPGVGLADEPLLIFGGELGPPEGRVGELVQAGPVGLRVVLIIGGPRGSSLGLQSGSVYVVPLSRFD